MKKMYVEPALEVMSFLSQERLMDSAYGKDGFQLFDMEDSNLGDIEVGESVPSGGATGWSDF